MAEPPGPAPTGSPVIRCRSLGLSFGAVRALHDVNLDLVPGRIHALVGQNGAGKTTLAKLLSGLAVPDTGGVGIAGRTIPPGSVRATRAAGLAMVHQHFSLPPSFTVAEALELTDPRPRGRPVYRRAELHRRWRAVSEEIEWPLSTRIRDLPVEARQSLEIARALATDVRILLLDEPTALLTPPSIDRLFERLRRLRDDGVTVLVVLHKLREVAAVADTVSVLRDGALVLGPMEMAETSLGHISDAIVGPASGTERAIHLEGRTGAEQHALLEMTGVSTKKSAFEPGLADIHLRVSTNEIVGIAGVEGNGQRSLVSAIAGLTGVAEGSVRLGGREATRDSPTKRRLHGLRLVPFDRNSEGISRSAPCG